jgi:hypothetical protein
VRTVWDILGLTVFIAAALWLGLIALVAPDRKPVVACSPVHHALGVMQRVVSATDGSERTMPGNDGMRNAGDRVTLACVAFVDRFVRTSEAVR